MKHKRGIELVGAGGDTGYTVGQGTLRGSSGSDSMEHTFLVEVWDEAPESGGQLIETISRSTDFSVSSAAHKAALKARPGKVLIHLNGRHRMSAERAPDPPLPL